MTFFAPVGKSRDHANHACTYETVEGDPFRVRLTAPGALHLEREVIRVLLGISGLQASDTIHIWSVAAIFGFLSCPTSRFMILSGQVGAAGDDSLGGGVRGVPETNTSKR